MMKGNTTREADSASACVKMWAFGLLGMDERSDSRAAHETLRITQSG